MLLIWWQSNWYAAVTLHAYLPQFCGIRGLYNWIFCGIRGLYNWILVWTLAINYIRNMKHAGKWTTALKFAEGGPLFCLISNTWTILKYLPSNNFLTSDVQIQFHKIRIHRTIIKLSCSFQSFNIGHLIYWNFWQVLLHTSNLSDISTNLMFKLKSHLSFSFSKTGMLQWLCMLTFQTTVASTFG
jgi:hypothetical protein